MSASRRPHRDRGRVLVVPAEVGGAMAHRRPARGRRWRARRAPGAGRRPDRDRRDPGGTPTPERPCWVVAASTASRSTRSFIGSPQWPFTQRKVTSPRWRTSSTNGSHRSRLATGLRLRVDPAPLQPPLPPPVAEAVDDVGRVAHDLERAVARGSAPPRARPGSPCAGWSCAASAPLANGPPSATAQAQPPGPGFPLHAPSVYTIVGDVGGHATKLPAGNWRRSGIMAG